MIIAVVGNVGSGKSLSVVKEIIDNPKKDFLINFAIKSKNCTRLKVEHVIKEEIERIKKTGTPVKKKSLNWDFWNDLKDKNKEFNICLDEVHNLVHSRASMTKNNILMSMWISQIRKLLGSSETANIWLITQRIARLDVAWRDLLHVVIAVRKHTLPEMVETKVYENGRYKTKLLNKVIIIKYYFMGEQALDKYYMWFTNPKNKTYDQRTFFVANPYFKYYDSYGIVKFGESVYL